MGLISKILTCLAKKIPGRVITRGYGEEPYLERYYLFRRRWMSFRVPSWVPGVYLHRFVASDDAELHNHPWSAVSLILSGGYVESRLDGTQRTLGPGSVNGISPDTFHRVDLLWDECWTLFFYGAKRQPWGFLNRKTAEFVHWREHERRRTRMRTSWSS